MTPQDQAAGRDRPPPVFQIGQQVRGTYLGQNFAGRIIAAREIAGTARFDLTLRFDAPVDVISFDSMSNFRTQVRANVSRWGTTAEKTSNGLPHMQIEMAQTG